MFVRAISRAVSASTRQKGEAYFRSGAVLNLTGDEWQVRAVVQGTARYRVQVSRTEAGFSASCECPFFVDQGHICKHIWAVLIAAEREGYLSGDGDLPEDPHVGLSVSPGDTGPPVVPPAVTPKRPEPWAMFLQSVQAELSLNESDSRLSHFLNKQIAYELDPTAFDDTVLVTVSLQTRKKDGGWSKPRPMTITPSEVDFVPEPDDREILGLLTGASGEYDYQPSRYFGDSGGRARYRLNGSLARRLIPLIARTGRAFLVLEGERHAEPVVWDSAGPWRFELAVLPGAGGRFRVEGILRRGEERMAITEPAKVHPLGFVVKGNTITPLDVDERFVWLEQLRQRGPIDVPREGHGTLIEALARSDVPPAVLPGELQYERVAPTPRPSVRLSRGTSAYVAREVLEARVDFEYDGVRVSRDQATSAFDSARRVLLKRDPDTEQRAVARLFELGFFNAWNYSGTQQLAINVEQFPKAVRALVTEGWRVEAEGKVFRAAQRMQLRVASGVDWLELDGSVDFGDGASAALTDLLAALRRGDATVTLDDGTRGLLPEEWLRRYAGIAVFAEEDGDHLRFRPSQTALLDALLESEPVVSVDAAFARAREALHGFDRVRPLDPPPTFRGALREYQREALGWLAFLRRFGFGGCLADDMGLGKTVMVLAMLDARRAERSSDIPRTSLVVVPRSLVFNWMDEARRFVPELRVLDYTGTARDAAAMADHDVVLTTYGTVRRDIVQLREHTFDYVVLDEAQAVKNASTASAKAVRLLHPVNRIALSGTPVENHIGELWSLFEFLNPGLLGPFEAFQKASRTSGRPDREELALVARAVRPFILRRTKRQVAPELPDRTEQTIHCELDTAQRRFYDELRAHYRSTLLKRIARDGLSKSKMQVLEALLRLRQAACHPALVDPSWTSEPAAKFDVLLPQLTEVIDEGHKALVFSQFTSLLALLRTRLDRQHTKYEYLDGQTRDRASRVARFQTDPACRLFLISLKAGGLGLNLTEAEYVFLLDPWWNPAVEAQAIDRAHRIGQSRHVFAYRLIARGTVEEKIADLQESKRELADAILSEDAGLLRDLKAEDLEWLLA
jgi:superfamily II DNA or RNA helicase